MRVLFVFGLALLVLPISGCAKKKKDESPATTASTPAANPAPGMSGHVDQGMAPPAMGDGGMNDPMAADDHEEASMEETIIPPGGDESVADASSSQNRNYFNERGNSSPGGQGSGQPNSPAGNLGQGSAAPTTPMGSPQGGHNQGGAPTTPMGSPQGGAPATPMGSPQGGHDQGAAPMGRESYGANYPGNSQGRGSDASAPINYPPGYGSGSAPNTPPAEDSGKGLSGFAQKVVGFFGGEGAASKPSENQGEEATSEEDFGETPAAGDLAGEGYPMGEGGQPNSTPRKASDVKGVKEGTPEFAVVSLILKVSRGEKDGFDKWIAEDAKGLAADLRSEDNEKALAEAKELMGRVKYRNSRLENRDSVLYFANDKDKILQFYVRKIQGEYVVREVRVLDAKTPAARRRN